MKRLFFLMLLFSSLLHGQEVATPALVSAPKIFDVAIETNLTLNGATWEDLGLSSDKEFKEVLSRGWLEWLSKEWAQYTPNIEICREVCPESVKKLKITVNISRVLSSQQPLEYKMTYTGGLILEETASKKILNFKDLAPEWKVVRFTDQKDFNSNLITLAYRMPMGKLFEMRVALGGQSVSKSRVVWIKKTKSSLEANQFMDFLVKSLQVPKGTYALESFAQDSRKYHLTFEGNSQEIEEKISKLNGSKWNEKITLKLNTTAEFIEIILERP